MKVLCVIPARIASTRLKRKPLQMLGQKPIIQHTYDGAKDCPYIDELVVATDSEEVLQVVEGFGGKAVMTDPELPTGSDRVAAVANYYSDVDVVVNLQGDEPFIEPEMLTILLQPYLSGEMPDMATVAYPLDMEKAYYTPHRVKVIYDQQGYALYFSRSPIPYFRQEIDYAPVLNHMGVYAFRADFLKRYTSLKQTPLETAESLEQLRVLEHGYKIKVCPIPHGTLEINTPEELELAQKIIRQR